MLSEPPRLLNGIPYFARLEALQVEPVAVDWLGVQQDMWSMNAGNQLWVYTCAQFTTVELRLADTPEKRRTPCRSGMLSP